MMNSAETNLKDGLEADVVVIAAGTAGLAAAITAAEGGARVIALEKSDKTGGTAKMGSGPFAVESRPQRLKQLTLLLCSGSFLNWKGLLSPSVSEIS